MLDMGLKLIHIEGKIIKFDGDIVKNMEILTKINQF